MVICERGTHGHNHERLLTLYIIHLFHKQFVHPLRIIIACDVRSTYLFIQLNDEQEW